MHSQTHYKSERNDPSLSIVNCQSSIGSHAEQQLAVGRVRPEVSRGLGLHAVAYRAKLLHFCEYLVAEILGKLQNIALVLGGSEDDVLKLVGGGDETFKLV